MNFDPALVLSVAAGVTLVVFLFNLIFLRTRDKPWLLKFLGGLFPVLAFVFVLRSFIVEPFQIPSSSMLPTLKIGDHIAINKFSYGLRVPVTGDLMIPMGKPERGDVVVFRKPDEQGKYYIKRIVGMPGDTISYRNSTLIINGQQAKTQVMAKDEEGTLLQEAFGSDPHHILNRHKANYQLDGQWVVPKGEYFMMGDNRDNSSDSRAWGTVPEHLISGKAFAVWMSWDKLFSVPDFSDARLIK